MVLEQKIKGSRKVSNYLVASMLTIGGVGFLLASFSSYFGRDFLPLGNPSTLIFVPQGLVMGLYGVAAFLLAIYFWRLISIDYGSGINRFDKNKGVLSLSRRGLLRNIEIEIPIDEIKAVKLEVREGFNPLRRVSLRIKGRKDLPISRVGSPKPLLDLENEGAEIARFLEVNLEGI
ncbi:photosystem I assembly protein Ycf4 [Prochlorococcus sp. MIT 0801]|uniref:photosystem I assembly protein Ycf4 n=1 Tax=Prochlorococcus sp. MIT 0801 TaxID=1501269 RepID=UPI000570F72E